MRRAVITCAGEVLRELGPLFDAGLSIDRSLESAPGVVVFAISGAALPEECDHGVLREVSVTFTRETYGAQSIVRVSAIRLTGRTIIDVSPVLPRAA